MNDQDELFERKHLKLWRFSAQADLFSRIVFLIYIFVTLQQIFEYNNWANTQYHTNLIGLYYRNPVYILDLLFSMARVFFQGTVYYLVLKGLALALNMIIETDINYRDQKAKEGVE